MAKVSIVVPVYNTDEKYFKKCIESLIEQTERKIEIIIVDDGSKKEVAQVCDNFSKIDERICVIHKENEGVSVARNTGMTKASGEWLLFVDSDDWLEKDAVEKILKYADGLDVVISKHFEDNEKQGVDTKNSVIIEENQEEMINSLFLDLPKEKMLGAIWGKLYNRRLLIDNKIYFEKGLKMGEDFLFNFEVLLKSKKIGYISDFLYHYRKENNGEAVTQKFDEKMFEKYDLLFQAFERNFKSIITEIYEKQYEVFVIRQLDYLCRIHIYNANNNETNFEKKNKLKEIVKKNYYKEAISKVNIKLLSKRKKVLVILLRLKLYGFERIVY